MSHELRVAISRRWQELLPYVDHYIRLHIDWEQQNFDMELTDAWTGHGGIIVMDR